MRRFDSDNGFIHFTFANEDHYIKESLACLNLSQNLYYELKKSGYKTVYYISIVDGKYRISFGDSEAGKNYEEAQERGFLSGLFKKTSQEEGVYSSKTMELSQKQDLLKRLFRIMKNRNAKSAFVFTIEAFDTFRGSEKEWVSLSNDNYNYNNLVLIKAPVETEGSLRIFEDEESIFRSELFPNIQNIFESYANVRFYNHMKNDLPNRVSCLNTLGQTEIRNLIQYMILNGRIDMKNSLSQVEDYTACIWYLYHSVQFRIWARQQCIYLDRVFPLNPKRKLQVIEEALEKEAGCRVLEELAGAVRSLSAEEESQTKELHKLIPKVLNIYDSGEEWQEYLFQNRNLWHKIEQMDYETLISDEKKNSIQEKLLAIRKELLKPCIFECMERHRGLNVYLDEYINCANGAILQKDSKTLEYALEAIHYTVCKCEQEMGRADALETKEKREEAEDSCLRGYKHLLSYQGQIAEYRNQIREIKGKLQEDQNGLVNCNKEVKKLKDIYPNLSYMSEQYRKSEEYRKTISPQLAEHLNTYHQICRVGNNYSKAVKSRKQAIQVAEEALMQAQQIVRDLEVSMSGIVYSQVQFVNKKVYDAMQDIHKVFGRVTENLKEGQNLLNYEEKEKVDFTMDNIFDWLDMADMTDEMNYEDKWMDDLNLSRI